MDLRSEFRPSLSEVAVKVDDKDIRAYRSRNEIWMQQASAIDLIDFYFHEAGHVLGDKMSFQEKDVLTPDEAKTSVLNMDYSKIDGIERLLASEEILSNREDIKRLIDFGNQILKAFTRGKFNPKSIKYHTNLSHEELLNVMRQRRVPVTTVFAPNSESQKVEYINSKFGRNQEMPSYATEIACLNILANTIRLADPSYMLEKLPPPAASPHLRAYKIVQRAYSGNNWLLPSSKDLF